jgi:hypothetical protein
MASDEENEELRRKNVALKKDLEQQESEEDYHFDENEQS